MKFSGLTIVAPPEQPSDVGASEAAAEDEDAVSGWRRPSHRECVDTILIVVIGLSSLSDTGMTEPTSTAEDPEGEERGVYRWRLRGFGQLTGSIEAAERLAISDADLGRARTMIGEGCPPELLVEILV
jgi:hypothetical protein